MTERDVFEVRFEAAVRGYVGSVSSDLDPAELAHRIAVVEPRRRGLAAALRARPVAAPRPIWVLLLLAALLLALVGGTLLVGSRLQRRLPAVLPPVGQVYECPPGSNPDEPGPVDQARPTIGDGIAAMAFDRRAERIVLLVELASAAETWTFDVCTNVWTRMHPDLEPGGLESVTTHLVYDVDSDATVAIDGQSTWVYDLANDTWTRNGTTPAVRQWDPSLTYDPVSGLVLAAGADELWSYDVETDAWAPISAVPWPAGEGAIAYDTSVDRLVAYARSDASVDQRPGMWLFDVRAGTWSRSSADTPLVVCNMGWPHPAIVYDEGSERTIVSCNAGAIWGPPPPVSITVAFDAAADHWGSMADEAGPFGVYDPVNGRFVGLEDDGAVAAFDLATQERTVLLAPRDGQPAPSPG